MANKEVCLLLLFYDELRASGVLNLQVEASFKRYIESVLNKFAFYWDSYLVNVKRIGDMVR